MTASATVAEPAYVDLRAWSTSVRVAVTEPATLPVARRRTTAFLDAVDRACSRFRPDSELLRLSRAAGRTVPVSPLLLSAVTVALRAADATGGLVTPTVAAALEAAGYATSFELVGTTRCGFEPRPVAPRVPDWRRVAVDEVGGTVRLPPGTALDLGSTTKAWAADLLSGTLAGELGCGVLVSLGGDISVAGTPPGPGWVVEVLDSDTAVGAGAVVMLAEGALATSSTVHRRWTESGEVRHHIIDPRTGEPAEDYWRIVTVAAGTCVDANTASTAAVVLGRDAPSWLAEVGLAARLVDRRRRVVTVGGWPGAA